VKTHGKNSDFHKWFHLGRVTCKWFHKWKLIKIFWFSQVTSLGTCHRHVTGHTKNEYKEQVKSRETSKNFHLNFHFWKCEHPIQFSIWSVTCSSLVQEDMTHGIHKVIYKWNFYFGTEGSLQFAWVLCWCVCVSSTMGRRTV